MLRARLLFSAACVFLLPSLAQAQAQAAQLSPRSSGMVLEAAARSGDEAAKWSLAWLSAEQGGLERAWRWVEPCAPRGEDQIYFKAWLAWRMGNASAALEGLASGACRSEACSALAINIYWDQGAQDKAEAAALAAYEASRSPRAFHTALLSALTAKDLTSFDRLVALVPWRDSADFASWRPAIASLVKTRANF